MKELEQPELPLTETRGLGGYCRGQEIGGMADEKRFLGLNAWCGETLLAKGVNQPVPADVARKVLFTGAREQVVGLGVAMIRAGGACGRGFEQLSPRLAIIERDEKAGPWLGRDLLGEFNRCERKI